MRYKIILIRVDKVHVDESVCPTDTVEEDQIV